MLFSAKICISIMNSHNVNKGEFYFRANGRERRVSFPSFQLQYETFVQEFNHHLSLFSEVEKMRVVQLENPGSRVEEVTLESDGAGRVLAVGREDLRPEPETV